MPLFNVKAQVLIIKWSKMEKKALNWNKNIISILAAITHLPEKNYDNWTICPFFTH
jgi:hypothetical protein